MSGLTVNSIINVRGSHIWRRRVLLQIVPPMIDHSIQSIDDPTMTPTTDFAQPFAKNSIYGVSAIRYKTQTRGSSPGD